MKYQNKQNRLNLTCFFGKGIIVVLVAFILEFVNQLSSLLAGNSSFDFQNSTMFRMKTFPMSLKIEVHSFFGDAGGAFLHIFISAQETKVFWTFWPVLIVGNFDP